MLVLRHIIILFICSLQVTVNAAPSYLAQRASHGGKSIAIPPVLVKNKLTLTGITIDTSKKFKAEGKTTVENVHYLKGAKYEPSQAIKAWRATPQGGYTANDLLLKVWSAAEGDALAVGQELMSLQSAHRLVEYGMLQNTKAVGLEEEHSIPVIVSLTPEAVFKLDGAVASTLPDKDHHESATV